MPDLAVAVIYPELLGLYADQGNALGFRHRARLRGLETEIIQVPMGVVIPASADLYILGGAEDSSMPTALALLRNQGRLGRAVERGASVLGVCAGLQILGDSFLGPNDEVLRGLGLLPVACRRLPGSRAVGEIAVASPLFGELQGFENHRGDARLGADAIPLGVVTHGIGSGHHHVEGVIMGNLIGTYLHGPVLVRNPAMADFFLGNAIGGAVAEVTDDLIEQYRAERRAEMRHPHHRR